MAVRPLTTSAPVAKRSGKAAAPKNTAKAATRKSAPLPEGADESDDIDFGDDEAPVAKPARGKGHVVQDVTEERAPRNKAGKAKGGSVTLNFVLEKETAGAGQYCEVDEAGKKLGIKEACMGKPYLRKDKVGGVLPKKFSAVITW